MHRRLTTDAPLPAHPALSNPGLAVQGACFDFEDMSAMCEDYENKLERLQQERDELAAQLAQLRAANAAQAKRVKQPAQLQQAQPRGRAPAAPRQRPAQSTKRPQAAARPKPAAQAQASQPRRKAPPPIPGEQPKRRIMRSARR